jgi:tetratricopeptide (TPR) repeat protein
VLKLQPELTCVLLNRAIAYESAGDLQHALADLNAAIARGKVPPRAYFLRSRVRLKLQDVAGAESDRLEGLKLEPIDDVDWVAHGTAKLRDDPDGALRDFHSALKLNPHSRLALQNIVHVTADRLNLRDDALNALNAWLKLEPANSNALIGRAVLKGRLGVRHEALADMEAALKSSQDPGVLFQAACVLSMTATAENQDGSRGLLLLSRAVQLDPKLMSRAATDPDLRSLRERSEYAAMTEQMQKLREVQNGLKTSLQTATP